MYPLTSFGPDQHDQLPPPPTTALNISPANCLFPVPVTTPLCCWFKVWIIAVLPVHAGAAAVVTAPCRSLPSVCSVAVVHGAGLGLPAVVTAEMQLVRCLAY